MQTITQALKEALTPPVKCSYIEPQDVVHRLLYAKPHWFHGNPIIQLTGENGSVGQLSFDFIDVVVKYEIFIKDRDSILKIAKDAIMGFKDYAKQIYDDR